MNERSNEAAAWPRAVNHIGVTVPDIFAAVDWYRDVLGLTHITGPRVLEAASQATRSYAEVFANWPQPGMTAPRMITREQAAAERRSRGDAPA